MVWLDTMTQAGQGLYLDVWKREKSRSLAGMELISGILGDGCYEGEVLIEVAPESCEITFIDQVLDPVALRDFFARFDREQLLEDLQRALRPEQKMEPAGLPLFRRDASGSCYGFSCLKDPAVQEKMAVWRSDSPRLAALSRG